MTNEQHPITPPDQLVQQWINNAHINQPNMGAICREVATKAIQWGWDQRGAATEAELQQARDEELNACCEWLDFYSSAGDARDLRLARRHEPPSLQEQALDALQSMRISPELIAIINANTDLKDKYVTIRRALEIL